MEIPLYVYVIDYILGVITEAAHVFVEPISINGVKATLERYLDGTLKHRLEKHHGEKTESMFYGWADVWLSSEFQDWLIPMETLGKIVDDKFNDSIKASR